jgi:XTP/dITP diphosphohydrolase
MKLVFATNNKHKVEEIRHVIGDSFELITLKEAGIDIDIPEPHPTLEANATEKSRTIYAMTGLNCFSEDTGLEVTALKGEPGVRSARFAGDEKSHGKNISKLLDLLQTETDRSARFRTVISLIMNGEETLFEGVCAGTIIAAPRGDQGFGYDPVFVPEGADQTFAEMNMQEKSRFSHREKATAKLVAHLQTIQANIKN